MSDPLETTPQTAGTLLTPLGATDAETTCVDGVCMVSPAKAEELVDED